MYYVVANKKEKGGKEKVFIYFFPVIRGKWNQILNLKAFAVQSAVSCILFIHFYIFFMPRKVLNMQFL